MSIIFNFLGIRGLIAAIVACLAIVLGACYYISDQQKKHFMEEACYVFDVTDPDQRGCYNPNDLKQIDDITWEMKFIDKDGYNRGMIIKRYPGDAFLTTQYKDLGWNETFNNR